MQTEPSTPLAPVQRCYGLILALAMVLVAPVVAYEVPENSPVADALRRADAAVDRIVAVPAGQRTFENTLGALDDMQAALAKEVWYQQVLAFLSPEADARERGWEANKHLEDFQTELQQRDDLYQAVRDFATVASGLTPEQQRYVEHTLRDYRRAGFDLPAERRREFTAITKRLSDLTLDFSRNIQDDETRVPLLASELAGVPERTLASLERSGDVYLVPLNWPIQREVLRSCTVPATRQKMYIAGRRQGGEKNIKLLEEIVSLRTQRAQLLGFDNAADYVLEHRMAGNSEAVWDFYAKLVPLVNQKAAADLAELTEAKRQHTNDPNAQLEVWDERFYRHKLLTEKYQVNDEVVRQYFPLDRALQGAFDITSDLFGFGYREVTNDLATVGLPETWHPDVRVFEVVDERQTTPTRVGFVYFDLFTRPFKDDGAWCWGVLTHRIRPDGHVERPLIVVQANFTPASEGKPALLNHQEMVTFFHEYGHAIHGLLSETRYRRFAGTSVAWDFVEMPSQMLEAWMWDARVLQSFARHYRTEEPIPSELVERLLAARHFASGLATQRQIWLGKMDMTYHTDPDGVIDTTAESARLFNELTPYTCPDHTFFQAGFGHLMGYQSAYYGYLWSRVFAEDLAAEVRKTGLLSRATGDRLREKILARGGTVDEMQMLVDFLGREPNFEPFSEYLGLPSE